MPGLQEFIHKWDVGEGTKIIRWVALGMLALALAFVYDLREYKNFGTAEAMDAAQLARNIKEGRGYTTKFVRPLSLYLVQSHRSDGLPLLREGHPDLANPPLYPLLLAGLMKALPFDFEFQKSGDWRYQPEMIIALFNQVLFGVAIGLVFRLAKRLFDSGVAWFTAAVFFCSDLFWRFSVAGLSTMLLVVILLGVAGCLVRLEEGARLEQHRLGWFILRAMIVGILVGLGSLTRYSFAFLILPVVAYFALFLGPKRSAAITATVLAFGLLFAPWIVRNYAVSGTPFGTAGYAICQETPKLPGNTLERLLKPDFAQRHQTGFDDYLKKFDLNISQILHNDLPKMGGSWLSAFFLAGLLIGFRSVTLSRLRIFLLLSLALMAVVQALGRTHLSTDSPEINSENQLVLLAPLVMAFGASFLFVLLDQVDFPFRELRRVIVVGVGLVLCAPLIFTLLPPRSYPMMWPPYHPWLVQHMSRWLEERELMMSDMPWAVAWYGDRSCVWLAMDYQEEFYAISFNRKMKPVSALYITQVTLDEHFLSQLVDRTGSHPWGYFVLEVLRNNSIPTGFPLKYGWRNILPDQIFLADTARWNNPPPLAGKK